MRIIFSQPDDRRRGNGSRAGHTLIEAMLAIGTIIIMVIMALMAAHLMGLRQNQLVQSKCGASDSSRRALQNLPVDIRMAKMWNLNPKRDDFVAITNGAMQGTALELCSTTNGSQYTLYYFDTNDVANSDGKLMSTSITNWNPVVIASNLINTLYFTAEDFRGITQTNFINGRYYKNVIHVNLQFCQFQYPQTTVGTNGLYDYYKLEFRATPHLPE